MIFGSENKVTINDNQFIFEGIVDTTGVVFTEKSF